MGVMHIDAVLLILELVMSCLQTVLLYSEVSSASRFFTEVSFHPPSLPAPAAFTESLAARSLTVKLLQINWTGQKKQTKHIRHMTC